MQVFWRAGRPRGRRRPFSLFFPGQRRKKKDPPTPITLEKTKRSSFLGVEVGDELGGVRGVLAAQHGDAVGPKDDLNSKRAHLPHFLRRGPEPFRNQKRNKLDHPRIVVFG